MFSFRLFLEIGHITIFTMSFPKGSCGTNKAFCSRGPGRQLSQRLCSPLARQYWSYWVLASIFYCRCKLSERQKVIELTIASYSHQCSSKKARYRMVVSVSHAAAEFVLRSLLQAVNFRTLKQRSYILMLLLQSYCGYWARPQVHVSCCKAAIQPHLRKAFFTLMRLCLVSDFSFPLHEVSMIKRMIIALQLLQARHLATGLSIDGACLMTSTPGFQYYNSNLASTAKPSHNDTRYSDIRGFNDTIVGPARFR